MALQSAADILSGGIDMGSPFWAYFGLSGIALAVSTVIIAFLYMWGHLFRNSALVSYVKLELYELFVSAIIALFVIGAVQSLDTISIVGLVPTDLIPADYAGVTDSNRNVYTMTESYFRRVAEDMGQWLQLNYIMGTFADMLATLTINARPLGMGLVASPLSGFGSPFKQLLYNMSVALTIAYVINYAQLYVYIFALQAFLKYYLPVGIFFRCFTPTRRLGGAIIALAVSFLVLLPILISFNYAIFYNPKAGPMVTLRGFLADYIFNGDKGLQPVFENFYEKFRRPTDLIDLVGGGLNVLATFFQTMLGGIFLIMILVPIAIIGWAFVIGYIIPTFTIMIFVQGAKYLGKTFGEEIDISALTRLI